MAEAPTSIRFPATLRERIEARAAAERRTISGLVMFLVESALGPEPPRETEGPLTGELLGARKLVEDLGSRGLNARQAAVAVGLDPERVAQALGVDPAKLADLDEQDGA